MKITLANVPHLANKVAVELLQSGHVTMTNGIEPVIGAASKVITADIEKERALEERVNEIVDEHEDDIENNLVDERQLFFMIKKRLADEYDVILNYEERFSDIAHKILDELYEEDHIHYDVNENKIKNAIYNAMTSFIADDNAIDDAVRAKIASYKRKIIPGTEDFDILYEKLYHEEMAKRGNK